jgi:hypothetical protein
VLGATSFARDCGQIAASAVAGTLCAVLATLVAGGSLMVFFTQDGRIERHIAVGAVWFCGIAGLATLGASLSVTWRFRRLRPIVVTVAACFVAGLATYAYLGVASFLTACQADGGGFPFGGHCG